MLLRRVRARAFSASLGMPPLLQPSSSTRTATIPPAAPLFPPAPSSARSASADAAADAREALLEASLRNVPRHGWTWEALSAGAAEMGYPAVATGLLPGGPVELVWHVMRGAQRRMNAALAATDLAPLSVNERVALAVRARLSAFAPYGPGWASAMALGASPGALPTTLALLGAAVDDAWWAAGDRSVDLSWYTRRALLAGVSAATEVYMLTDSSPDRGDTWAFLEARLGEVRAVARSAEEAARVAAAAGAGAAAAAGAALDVARPALVGRDGEGLAGCLRGCGGSSGGSGEPAAGLLPPLLALAGRAAQGALAAAEAAGAGALGTAAGAQLPALLAALLPPAPGSGVGAPSGGGPPPPVAPTPRPASAAAPPPLRPV